MTNMNRQRIKLAGTLGLLAAMFFVGRGAAMLREDSATKPVTNNSIAAQTDNWGLGFGADGTKPTGNVTPVALKSYDAYYVGSGDDKVIYLTYDCGYGDGYSGFIYHLEKDLFSLLNWFFEFKTDMYFFTLIHINPVY